MKLIFKTVIKIMIFNKKRTVFIITGIILSVILITMACAFSVYIMDVQENSLFLDFCKGKNLIKTYDKSIVKNWDSYKFAKKIIFIFLMTIIASAVYFIKSFINVTDGEREKCLAIMSTQGLEKNQKYLFYLCDAVIFSALSIPFGVLLGITPIYYIIQYSNSIFLEYFNIPNSAFLHQNIPLFIFIVFGISFSAVIFSYLYSAYISSKNSDSEKIMSFDSINILLKERKIHKFAEKFFGIAGKLATANFTNQKYKYKNLAFSVTFATLVFISLSISLSYLDLQKSLKVQNAEKLIPPFMSFFALFLVIILISSICNIYVKFNKRKCEFAVIKSIGAENTTITKIIIIESLYFAFYLMLYIFTGSTAISALLYFWIIKPISNIRDTFYFIFPFKEILLSIPIDLFVSMIIYLIIWMKYRKSNIVYDIKEMF